MDIGRRALLAMAGAAAISGLGAAAASRRQKDEMYGLIGKMIAAPGQRDALIAILLEGLKDMPGCLSYIVARDPADGNAIWITEVWDGEASHKASLSLTSVKAAITKGKPLIASFGDSFVTSPVGGHGLTVTRR